MIPKPPGLLVRYLQQGRCVVFVGAGLSAGAGLPTWSKLLLEVIQELGASMPQGEAHQEELQKLVKLGKLLEVADFCKEQLGAAYHQFLTERLRGDKGQVPATHALLMRLPFSAWVTTNYDKLLERAYSDVKGGFPKTLTHKDTDTLGRLLFDVGPFILKAHGDIDRPETVVLTSRDYSEIIHANPAFNEIFTGLLLTKALFFVGYSLSDPDFRLLMDRQLTHFKGFVPERYALMTDLGPVERDVLWRTARIQVIPYTHTSGRHEEVLHFLEALHAAVLPEPPAVPPGTSLSFSEPTPTRMAHPKTVAHNVSETAYRSLEKLLQEDTAPAAAPMPPMPVLSFEAAVPPPAPARPQPIPAAPCQLFIEEVEGRVQLRLSRGPLESLAQGVAPSELNEEMWQSFKRAVEESTSRRGLYSQLSQLLEKYLPASVLGALGGGAVSAQAMIELHLAPELARFPWELLPLQGQPMSLQRKLVRAPVGVSQQARGRPPLRDSPRVLLIEGSGGGREAQLLAPLYQRHPEVSFRVLRGVEATFGRVIEALDGELPDLLHFSGKVGQVEGELYLDLPGDMELSMGALRSVLNRGRLPFLVINAPSSAFAPYAFGGRPRAALFEGRPGWLDLATQTGVGAFVGAFDTPSPEAGAAFMLALHRELLGRLPITEALRRARAEVHPRFPEDPTALQYVLSGDGALALR